LLTGTDPAILRSARQVNSSDYLHALGNDPKHMVVGAVVEGNFHQPGSLVQVNHACRGNKSSILAAGVDGLLVASASALNAGVGPDGPFAEGGDAAGCPLVVTGTDPATWTARGISITNPGGYASNNLLVLRPDCPSCVDVEAGASARLAGEPARDYGSKVAANMSLWPALPPAAAAAVRELPAAESYEQQPTYLWRMPDGNAAAVGALALTVDLSRTPSLAARVENGVPVAATIVVGLAANLSAACADCSLHFLVRSHNRTASEVAGPPHGDAGWLTSAAVNSTAGAWAAHSFATKLGAFAGGCLEVGIKIELGGGGKEDKEGEEPEGRHGDRRGDGVGGGAASPLPRPGDALAMLSGFSVRRLGATPVG
jgi:hypothetical protein